MKREAEDGCSESADKLAKTMEEKEGGDHEATFITPSTARPDRETELFDRQLRLWESSGQQLIQEAAVKICDCCATSAQIAKNLILCGIKRIEMLDNKVVRQSEIGHNFFLEQSSLGQKRGKECCRLLDELSSSKYAPTDWDDDLLDSGYFESVDPSGLWTWQAHVCVRRPDKEEQVVSYWCWDQYVPTILVQTCGLVASIRLQIRELSIIQTHSESLVDLRLDCPFPSLSAFVNSFEMDKLDNHEHAHVPAVVIIIHFMEMFKSQHDGKLPQDSAEREELKRMILAEKRSADEDNFDEAVGMIWKACQPTKVPAHVEELFNDPQCDKAAWWDGRFWMLVKSLREFVRRNASHQLPLSGALPDMKSDTQSYTKMQAIYRQQASEDLETFTKIMDEVQETLEEAVEKKLMEDRSPSDSDPFYTNIGVGTDGPRFDVSSEMVASFVKNAAHIRVVRGGQYGHHPRDLMLKFTNECEPGNTEYTATWYFAFEALSSYRSMNDDEYPGMRKGQEEADFNSLCAIVLEVLTKHGWDEKDKKVPEKLQKALKEMLRSAGCELPHIASLVGGLVAQEITKLVTHQYVPTNGICIFDGYQSSMGILEF
ncbi:hypothetical protein PCANC_18901 [Puccinia coronata f. sp. avenae]|uniref:NEDD8-activating enzyme E1 regulatory subunit n=1 Tax=Puccinia coronata f. sp. avenae TaxID=200324 RepID=A0A2N5V4D4_9BASI|nr:hypothetical protein PCANC_18901 [Puccinia coronata f. sp. avenae]PLW24215.1 hypothetical protein PCASD_10464 [Puccinia coronata f. sp. avenae]PLW44835.1 hypothetical protein PCASD_07097 [Puccinia coronata f. sp. avenae]